MKKIVLVTCLIAVSSLLNAQHIHVNFGPKAGLNLAMLNTEDDAIEYEFMPSFHVGALAHMHFTKHFAVQPEILFSAQGAKYSLPGEDFKLHLNYVTLPIIGQYMFGNGFRLQTGPQLGVLVNAEAKTDGSSDDVKENFNKLDFSWVFGASYVTRPGLGFDARYNLGVSNINEVDAVKVRNSVIALGLFYQFKGKEK